MRTIITLTIFIFTLSLNSCSAFMYGWTEDLAFNSYYLVKSDKKDFGNRRMKYNKGMRKGSELTQFLTNKGNPDFAHEYESSSRQDVIELFYANVDSVFIFHEPNQLDPSSVFKTSRLLTEHEKLTYQKLLKETKK